MNRVVNSIAGRLSLRAPQREALEILDRVCELAPPRAGAQDSEAALDAIQAEFRSVKDFERDFPSICFALATGVGKTRLMGAFVSYLFQAHGIRNFFVLAPNLTIYDKLIRDFTPNTPKYVFTGIADFAAFPPEIITGDNYEERAALLQQKLLSPVTVNIFNISKINTEVRGNRAPRIKRLSELIGQSYYEYLAGLPDLVLIMDESHRYRASAGVKAINELKPVLGLELTATPFVEKGTGKPVPFRNVILDYPLGRAVADGFVKEPAVVTRKDFNPAGMSSEEIEHLKLEDGIRLHESVKVELAAYAAQAGLPLVKPFVLVIAKDTTHAAALLELVQSASFFDGRYAGRAIQVDSSQSGAAEEEMIRRLLQVEHADEPTEIVVHVNMLKEGWDVTNLYTIVPLRAANARTLIEQSIGRGLRLPYGRRTGVSAVDRLNIVAHDKFQEIVDEASRPDSPVRLQRLELDLDDLENRPRAFAVPPRVDVEQGLALPPLGSVTKAAAAGARDPEQDRVRIVTRAVLRDFESQPKVAPTVASLSTPPLQQRVLEQVTELLEAGQWLPGEAVAARRKFIAETVAETTHEYGRGTIGIPRVQVVPKSEVRFGFHSFTLDLSALRLQPPSEELWIRHLRTQELEVLGLLALSPSERRPEDYVVRALVDYDDVAYDQQAPVLYELAGQVVQHLKGYLSEEGAERVLRFHQREIGRLVHVQMQDHAWSDPVETETVVHGGFSEIKQHNFTSTGEPLDFRRQHPEARYKSSVFEGFNSCLFQYVKFDNNTERMLAVILDRDSLRWFRPAPNQFQIFYRWEGRPAQYWPDFVAEIGEAVLMIECKMRSQLESGEVLAKKRAAIDWCALASEHNRAHGEKPWEYVLVPHDSVAENMGLERLWRQFRA